MQRGSEFQWRSCSCGRRGSICACVPRTDMDPMLIQVLNESRRLRAIAKLRTELERDLLGVDVKWVLFGMALQSYRYEELLLPVPPAYVTPSGININSLSYVAGTMAELGYFQRRLLQNVLPAEQVELLHWLIVQSGTPQLRQLHCNEQVRLWRQLQQKPEPRPQLVFRVQQPQLDGEQPIDLLLDPNLCVYYSGDMEELYAMINVGNVDISKTDLEFYDDLEQACGLAEWTPGWGYSLCGALLRCVAVCQICPDSGEALHMLRVRYLLIYSMNYTQKMLILRRRQWKMLQQKQLLELEQEEQQQQQQQQQQQEEQQQEEQQQEEQQQEEQQQQQQTNQLQLANVHESRSMLGRLLSRRRVFVVLGVLTVASLSLMARNVHQLHQWRLVKLVN